jgi:hypothetical protein
MSNIRCRTAEEFEIRVAQATPAVLHIEPCIRKACFAQLPGLRGKFAAGLYGLLVHLPSDQGRSESAGEKRL